MSVWSEVMALTGNNQLDFQKVILVWSNVVMSNHIEANKTSSDTFFYFCRHADVKKIQADKIKLYFIKLFKKTIIEN